MRNFLLVSFVLACSPALFAHPPLPQPTVAHYSVTLTVTRGLHGKQVKSFVLAWLSPGGNAGFSAGAPAQMYKASPNAVNCFMPFARLGQHQVRLQCHGSFLWTSSLGSNAYPLDFSFNSGFPLNHSILVFRSRNRHDVRYQVTVLVRKAG